MKYYICVDVGGTNMTTGFFLAKEHGKEVDFELLAHTSYQSQELQGIGDALADSVDKYTKQFSLSYCPPINISACGPTDGETCQPTNLPAPIWRIDTRVLEKRFKTKIYLINDFASIAYSLMTLTSTDERIMHLGGSPTADFSHAKPSIKVALGAGTGLGCATIQNSNYTTNLIASEAGWTTFPPNPQDSNELRYAHFLSSLNPEDIDYKENRPLRYSWEDAICASRGLNAIIDFFLNAEYSRHIISDDERVELADALSLVNLAKRPRHTSILAHEGLKPAASVIRFWITLYARFAQQIALTTIPRGGLFLGGGAASKNTAFFLENSLFYNSFVTHENADINALLKDIPLYLIKDYHISLYGDAYHLYMKEHGA